MHVRSTLTLFGPRALPAPFAARTNAALAAAVEEPETRHRLQRAYIEIELSKPAELARQLASEQEELGSLVRSLNLRPE
jgi:tripartite-type tricarboxylate transporter receptor subunit TctC